MGKTVVVYQSRYGATKRYAEWIAQELSCDLLNRREIGAAALLPYDTVIYGGGLYAGGLAGVDLLTKNYAQLRGKHMVLFTCGLADPADSDNVDHIRQGLNKALPPALRESAEIFHLRGAMDYSRLGPVHRTMMAMLHKMTLKKDASSLREEDRQMLDTYGKTVDFTDRASIEPLIRYVRGL